MKLETRQYLEFEKLRDSSSLQTLTNSHSNFIPG